MKIFSANLDSLRKLYIQQIQTLLSVERQIISALPTMADKATNPDLKQAFLCHLEESKTHLSRLEQILEKPVGAANIVSNKVVSSMVAETEDLIKDTVQSDVRDSALITAGQRVEHYEMAVYGAVHRFAVILGEEAQAQLLELTFKEEAHADHFLTQIANRMHPSAEHAA